MIKGIVTIVSFTVAGGLYFMFTQPSYSNTKLLQTKIDQYNQALDKAAELKKLQETLLTRFNAFNKRDVEGLHKLLPDHVDNVRLILDLDHLASTFGMALQNVIISNPAGESADQTAIGAIGSGGRKYDSLTMKFTTHGTYANFTAFMESLESSLRIVDLVALTLTPTAQGGANAQAGSTYKYDITLKTYWLK
jgi:Tfp pilus assembly protein PilO